MLLTDFLLINIFMSFDSGQYFITVSGTIAKSSNSIVNQNNILYGGGYRSVGQPPVTVVNPTIQNLQGLPNLPLVNNLSVGAAVNVYKPPTPDPLSQTTASITGFTVTQSFVPSNPILIAQRISSSLVTLAEQISLQIQNCINQRILTMSRGNPLPLLLAAYESEKSQLLAQITATLNALFSSLTTNLTFGKIQIQQVTSLRQEILAAINALCTNADPTTFRNYIKSPTYVTDTANTNSVTIAQNVGNTAVAQVNTSTTGWSDLI